MSFSHRCKVINRGKLFIDSVSYRSINHLNCWKRGIYLQTNYRNKEENELSNEISEKYTSKNANYWNNVWKEHNYFSPRDDNAKNIFKMILPPPNVTGVLHLGHALTCTIQDILARWHRMKDKSVIWIPGLDHAGIATQAVVEKYLARTRGLGRYDMSKEDFVSCIKKWKEEKGSEIKNQLKNLGMSLDWSREFFTMSEEHSIAVTEAFVMLSEQNLLYKTEALINWSTTLRSAISDMEIEHVQITGKKYFVVPGYEKKIPFGLVAKISLNLRDSDEHLVIATTRVETMPGDVAIAVHPEDSRYSRYIGREVWHPIRETFIPIIQDSSVKRDFGTGAVKITPAHHHEDLAIAKRHYLDIIDVIGNDGNMTSNAKSFEGLGRFVAREKILNELSRQGALKSLENHKMLVPVCSRSGDIVEYLIREQWFLRTKEMAERAIEAVREGSLKIDPPECAHLWCDWLENNRDWCVSRQIWWGHKIPAYRCQGSDWIIARSEEEARRKLLNDIKHQNADFTIEQDPDVLDTWFSSALLPLTSAGWPDRKLEKFYPLSLMETGRDIIFLWVARMVMLGMQLTNALPFKEILFHGVLCDAQGKKMSKSRGNAVKPEHVINGISLEQLNAEAEESFKAGILSKDELEKTIAINRKIFPNGIPECGVDALRLTLCSHNVKNNRISFDVIECRKNAHFCNKIWQATRYILQTIDKIDEHVEKPQRLSTVDRWILSRLSFMVQSVNDALEEKKFSTAIRAIKQFFYYEFCDFFLEATKPAFKKNQREIIESHRYSLAKCLEVSLRILAPITPYISDELYRLCAKKLPKVFLSLPSLVEAPYPTFTDDFSTSRDPQLEKKFDCLVNVVCAIRQILTQINDKSNLQINIVTDVPDDLNYFAENVNFITAVTRMENIRVLPIDDYTIRENDILCVTIESECRVFLQLPSAADAILVKEKMENKRLQSENKLKNLMKNTGKSKLARKAENNRSRDLDKMKSLDEELKRYPKLS